MCGKVTYARVLITGGATGIGLKMVQELLRNGTKRVFIADMKKKQGKYAVKELNCEFGDCSATFMKCDVTKKSQMHDSFKCAIKAFGGLDLVINNAGILDDLHWEREIAVNLTATVRGSFLAMKYMGKHNGGCGGTIVNLSSILGLQSLASVPVYVGTKHAVLGFSRSLGMPFNDRRSGVRVITICPGVTITPMISKAHTLTFSKENAMQIREDLDSMPGQDASCIGSTLTYVLGKAENGSVWVIEGGKPVYEVRIPARHTLRKSKMV